MNKDLNHDRIAVFFKNLSLDKRGEDLSIVSEEIQDKLFENILNPEDCIWTNLVTPKNLQETFYFPQGNIDHIALTHKQMYFDRTFSSAPLLPYFRAVKRPLHSISYWKSGYSCTWIRTPVSCFYYLGTY